MLSGDILKLLNSIPSHKNNAFLSSYSYICLYGHFQTKLGASETEGGGGGGGWQKCT